MRSQYAIFNIFIINDALCDPSAANQNANFYHPMYGLQAAVTGTGKCSSSPPPHFNICLFVYMQSNGADGTKDWKMVGAEGPPTKDHIPVPLSRMLLFK